MTKYFSLAELAAITNADFVGDPDYKVCSVSSLSTASSQDASFLSNPKYCEAMKSSLAGVICVGSDIELAQKRNFLVGNNPSLMFQKIAESMFPSAGQACGFEGIHASAVIHKTARIGKKVVIAPHVVIDARAFVGDHTVIYPHVYVGTDVKIGKQCVLYSHSSIRERCVMGNCVILQPGAVIGSCGYGYTTDHATGSHTKLAQLGTVTLEDHVEVGANTTIDRARFETTIIREGTKIDNLVQIAHNVELGKNNLIVAQTGIAGSSKLGNNVTLGGQCGVVGHVTLGDHIVIATRGGVTKSVSQPGVYGGNPITRLPVFRKNKVLLRKIVHFVKELAGLKQRLEALENSKA